MLNLLLPLIIVLPLCGGIGLLVARRYCLQDATGEAIGLGLAIAMLVLSVMALLTSDWSAEHTRDGAVIVPQLEFSPHWLSLRLPSVINANPEGWPLQLGLDGIGMSMVLLTTVVTLAVLLVSRSTVMHDRSDFGAWILFANSGLMLVFMSMDLILFYVGFELALIPLFALIAFWGDEHADIAARRFLLYTLAGSIPMVLGVLGISQLYAGDGDWVINLPELSRRAAADAASWASLDSQTAIFAVLVLGLGIKMGLLPFHTWLPKTYGCCHPTAAAFLAAVVLKLGLFGFVRLALPMLPLACESYGPTTMGSLGAIAIVAGAMMALAQTDLRRLLAYSSLSHVGFVTLGLFALNAEGIHGGVLQMFNHGITTAAIFLTASCLIGRRGTARLDCGPGAIASQYPKLSAFMIFFLAAGAGVPGLNNFVGETLTLTAAVARQPMLAAVGVLGIVLGAWYSFRLIQTLLLGRDESNRQRDKGLASIHADINGREKLVFASLTSICLVIGIYPRLAIDVIRQDAQQIAQTCDIAQNSRNAQNPIEPNPVEPIP